MSSMDRLLKSARDEALELVAIMAAKKKAQEEKAFNDKRAEAERIEAAEYQKVRTIKGEYKYSKWDPDTSVLVKKETPKPKGWGDFA